MRVLLESEMRKVDCRFINNGKHALCTRALVVKPLAQVNFRFRPLSLPKFFPLSQRCGVVSVLHPCRFPPTLQPFIMPKPFSPSK